MTNEDLIEQTVPPQCAFQTRDSANTLENVFLSPSSIVAGTYRVRVIAWYLPGNGETNIQVHPDYVTDLAACPAGMDCGIDDRLQGYALIASGKVATTKGKVHFAQGAFRCGDDVVVEVDDVDPPPGAYVDVTSPSGDCERVPVNVGSVFHDAGPIMLRDLADGFLPNSCAMSDGILVAGDDTVIRATYV